MPRFTAKQHPFLWLTKLAIAWLAVTTCGPPAIGQTFETPIVATTTKETAPIYSGPGRSHYATNHLPKGSEVDVYRLDPGGWCAIRPHRDSFSLVRSSAVRIEDDGIGVVIVDGARAWVGTHNGAVNDPLWQVRLKRGEQVTVLGRISPEYHLDDEIAWVQISPPSGEFRWIHFDTLDFRSQLKLRQLQRDQESKTEANEMASRTHDPIDPIEKVVEPTSGNPKKLVSILTKQEPDDAIEDASNSEATPIKTTDARPREWPVQQASVISEASNSAESTTFGDSEAEIPSGQSPQDTEPLQDDDNQGWRPARMPMRSFIKNEGPIERYASNANPRFGASTSSPGSRATSSIGNSGTAGSSFTSPTSDSISTPSPSLISAPPNVPLTASLQQLDLELSNQVLGDPATWRLDELKRRTASLAPRLTDNNQRKLADHLLAKISRFQRIQNEYRSTARGTNPGNANHVAGIRQPTSATTSGPTETSGSSGDELASTYDAYGILNELVRDGGVGQTTYVLQDESGKITHHIAATPGLNLHRYLKTRVGIIGQKGYHQKLKLDHVTAERIVDLNRHWR